MEIKNYMETVVMQKLEELLKNRPDVCRCERCRLDIMAYALNNLPPKYYVTQKGELFSKAAALDRQLETDVLKTVIQGINKIAVSPHHMT